MRGGFRQHTPHVSHETDEELVERTRRFRRAFNEFYRTQPCTAAATAYAEAIVAAARQFDDNVIELPLPTVADDPEWGDAA